VAAGTGTARAPAPAGGRGWLTHPAVAVFEYHLVGYRRIWRGTVFSSFVMPVLFFLGMGLAVGSYVDRGGDLDLPYLQFIAPGLLAFTGLQIAMMESGFPVMGGFKWHRTYFGMAAAPPRVGDVIAGQLAYIAVRVLVGSSVFLLVMLPFGAVGSAWAVITPLVAVLAGMAVASPMFAYSSTVQNPNMLALMFRFGLLPMMLFSGVFFPVEQLPAALQPLAYVLPLWHGVELSRAAVLGIGTAWPATLHVAYLLLWVAAGFVLARATFRRRLAG
jgi:lipooligosaccharide transport system permease protein